MPDFGTFPAPATNRTMNHSTFSRRGGARRRTRALGAALLAVLALGACDALDKALEIDTPSRLPASDLLNPSNALLLVNSAQRDLECAYGAYIVTTGLLAGELQDGSPTAARWDFDRRTISPEQTAYATASCEGAYGIYTPLNVARYTADDATRRLEAWAADGQVENADALIARTANYAGWALVFLGESFCSASIDIGPELTSTQVFEEAINRFTKAYEAATRAGIDSLRYLALLGRAKARLNAGMNAEAMADAQQIPAGFVYNAQYLESNSRQWNRVYAFNGQGTSVTVAPAYRSIGDPRVPVSDSGRKSSDENTDLWVQRKYNSLSAPIPLARYEEAELIIAEVSGAMTPAQVADERRLEFFLEGRRFGDIRRYNLAYEPAPGTPYPAAAASPKGGVYADIPGKCLPLPNAERLNNPNIPDNP